MILTFFLGFSLIFISEYLKRRERDSNPRNTFGVYTLSRRASSTTRASLLISGYTILSFLKSGANYKENRELQAISATNVFFFFVLRRINPVIIGITHQN